MKTESYKRYIHRLILGSSLFGLFFGAGNLIFPVLLGQLAGSNYKLASLSFILSAVLMPVLAIIFIARSNSTSLEGLLAEYGRKYARFFTILLLLTIGPLFALPRTASVPYEVGVRFLLPNLNHSVGLLLYSTAFFAIALFLSLKPTKLKEIVGKYINPLFLTCLSIFFVIFFLNTMGPVSNIDPAMSFEGASVFISSFSAGYQTMDLLASLVFAYVIIGVNDFGDDSDSKGRLKDLIFAGVFAGALLALIYYILTVIGVSSRNVFDIFDNGGIALANIFNYYLGKVGTLFFAITITLACLKTAIGLINACSNYFSSVFPKVSYEKFAYVFAGLSLFISNVGLNSIIVFAVPVLNFIYPLAIMHVVYGLIFKNRDPFVSQFVLYITMIGSVMEVIKGLPNVIIFNAGLFPLLDKYSSLPLANLGLAWINFSIAGLVMALIFKYLFESNRF